MGYDGTSVAMATRPILTTVRQPIEAMGREMAHVLLRRFEHPLTKILAEIACPTCPDFIPSHVLFSSIIIDVIDYLRHCALRPSRKVACPHMLVTLVQLHELRGAQM